MHQKKNTKPRLAPPPAPSRQLSPAVLARKARDFLRLTREVREAAAALHTATRSVGHPAAVYFDDLFPRLRGLLLCASSVRRGMGARRPSVGPEGLDYVLTVAGSLLHQVELSRLATALDSGRRRPHASAFGLGAFLREAAVEGPFRGVSPVRVRLPGAMESHRVRGDRACLKRLLLYLLGRAASDGVRRPVELVARLQEEDALLSIEFNAGGERVMVFDRPLSVCLQGTGQFYFRDATGQPRTTALLTSTVNGDYTCATISHAGTVVLAGN